MRALHIGAPLEFTTEYLLPALAAHSADLPRMEFTFDVADHLIDDLGSGRLTRSRGRGRRRRTRPVRDGSGGRLRPQPADRPAVLETAFGRSPVTGPATLLPNLLAVKSAAAHGYG